MNTIHQEKINELVSLGLAKVVSFTISDAELHNEHQRIMSYGRYQIPFNKKNVAQTIVRRKIRETFPGWCEIRFSHWNCSSSIWINGNEFTVVIKKAYQRHEAFPENGKYEFDKVWKATFTRENLNAAFP